MVTLVSIKFICFFLVVMTVYGAFPCSLDSPCQLMMGREIRTLLPTLESNLKPVVSNQEAVTSKD